MCLLYCTAHLMNGKYQCLIFDNKGWEEFLIILASLDILKHLFKCVNNKSNQKHHDTYSRQSWSCRHQASTSLPLAGITWRHGPQWPIRRQYSYTKLAAWVGMKHYCGALTRAFSPSFPVIIAFMPTLLILEKLWESLGSVTQERLIST